VGRREWIEVSSCRIILNVNLISLIDFYFYNLPKSLMVPAAFGSVGVPGVAAKETIGPNTVILKLLCVCFVKSYDYFFVVR